MSRKKHGSKSSADLIAGAHQGKAQGAELEPQRDMRTKVYLSGGFYGTYKNTIRLALTPDRFILFDPEGVENSKTLLPGYYVGRDIDLIARADLVIAHQDDYPYVYGMAAEVGIAAALGVPVCYVCEGKRVDTFLAGLSRAIFTSTMAACEFILERYGRYKEEK